MQKKIVEKYFFCDIVNVFTVTFDQLNASLLDKSIKFLKKNPIDPNLFNSTL